MGIPNAVDHILLDETQIQARVIEIAAEIDRNYEGLVEEQGVVFIGVLRGAFIFLSDLTRHLNVRHEVDFVALSSYGSSTSTDAGAVRLIMDTRDDVAGRHVVIVEDIIDTGYTLEYLLRTFGARKPASLRTCVLLSKPERHKVDIKLDYLGFEIENVWVVGYGLDYANRFRTLPYIAALKPEVYGR